MTEFVIKMPSACICSVLFTLIVNSQCRVKICHIIACATNKVTLFAGPLTHHSNAVAANTKYVNTQMHTEIFPD